MICCGINHGERNFIMDTQYRHQINVKKIELLYRHAVPTILGTLIIAIVAVAFIYSVMWPEKRSADILFMWLTIYLLVCAIRLYGIVLYQKTQVSPGQANIWLYAYLAGIVVSGLLWGLLFLYLASFLDFVHTNFIVFFMEGMISAAVAAYATSFLAFLTASTTLLCPIIVYFLLHSDPQTNYLGTMLIIYLGFLLIISRQLNSTISNYLTHQFNADKFERERNYAAMINRELEEEILRRISTEDKLKSEIQRAEELTEKLITISSRDGLTGINNRRRFDEHLVNEWNRLARTHGHLSLILCDIDFYKAFNDTYGHLTGDECLQKIAGSLQNFSRRAGDLAARYGGEEFAVILPETGLENASRVAEDIRAAIENMQIPHSSSSISPWVTVSLGVATVIPSKHDTHHSLIKLADDALYSAKHAGRNRVVTQEEGYSDADKKVDP